MRKLALLAGLLIGNSMSTFAAVPEDWERLMDEDGIEVFKKEISGSPIIAFKGQGLVDAPISKVASILFDINSTPQWMKRVSESKLIRKVSDFDYIVYNHVETPFILKDRDFVLRNTIEVNPKEKTLVLRIRSIIDPAAPDTECVRGETINSSFHLISMNNSEKTYVISEIHADPRGSVPKWLVNLFQKEVPLDILKGLRKQALKADILEDPYYKKVFSEASLPL